MREICGSKNNSLEENACYTLCICLSHSLSRSLFIYIYIRRRHYWGLMPVIACVCMKALSGLNACYTLLVSLSLSLHVSLSLYISLHVSFSVSLPEEGTIGADTSASANHGSADQGALPGASEGRALRALENVANLAQRARQHGQIDLDGIRLRLQPTFFSPFFVFFPSCIYWIYNKKRAQHINFDHSHPPRTFAPKCPFGIPRINFPRNSVVRPFSWHCYILSQETLHFL